MSHISLEDAKNYINSIDFSNMINKMISHDGWRRKDAIETCEMYKKYLFLKKKYGDQKLCPTTDIDMCMHNHILDTKNYIEHCMNIFGAYLHHYPYLGIDDKTNKKDLYDLFHKTQELFFKEFGTLMLPTRSKYCKLGKLIYFFLYKIDFILISWKKSY